MNIISFDNLETLNNNTFMYNLWKQFYKIKNKGVIIIDLRNIKFISPLVLPKLCSLGMILRKQGFYLQLMIEGNSDVKYYLSQVGFFDIVKSHEIMYVHDGYTGGEIEQNNLTYTFIYFEKESLLKKYNRLYTFNDKAGLSDRLKFCIKMEVFGLYNEKCEVNENSIQQSTVLKILKKFSDDYNEIKSLGLDFAEVIHNSVWHGGGKCFFAMQVGRYNKTDRDWFERVEISVADNGDGLYNSLSKKCWKKENKITHTIPLDNFLKLKKQSEKCYYSSIELLLYRKYEAVRGMYDFVWALNKKADAEINIINKNQILQLDNNDISNILKGNYKNLGNIYNLSNIDYSYSIDISFKLRSGK